MFFINKMQQDGPIAWTIEGTTGNATYDMTVKVEGIGRTIILKMANFEVNYVGASNYPRFVNLAINNIMGANNVIDNDAGYQYLKIALEYNTFTIGGTTFINSTTYPDIAFKMSGELSKVVSVRLLDENHAPLTGLVHYFLQFQIL